MKRTILALAFAGLSVAAYASPPPGGGPPTPIDVKVVNSVPLPVTSSPLMTPLAEYLGPTFVADPNGQTTPSPYSDVVLSGFVIRAENRSIDHGCNVSLTLNYDQSTPVDLFY